MYTILHLEKSSFIRKMLNNVMFSKGFNYTAVETASEAYNILNNNKFDLIITSLIIEDDSIENFMKTINKSLNADTPVFVITGNNLDEDKKRILNLGVADYLTKEELQTELLNHIKEILKQEDLLQKLQNAKIAIVDDTNFEAKITIDILNSNNITKVDYYESGWSLLESNKKYDIYLIDIVLKNEFGRNIIMQLRKDNPDATIVILSSLTNTKTLSSILNAGANDYIRKPIQEDLFIAKLKADMRNAILIQK